MNTFSITHCQKVCGVATLKIARVSDKPAFADYDALKKTMLDFVSVLFAEYPQKKKELCDLSPLYQKFEEYESNFAEAIFFVTEDPTTACKNLRLAERKLERALVSFSDGMKITLSRHWRELWTEIMICERIPIMDMPDTESYFDVLYFDYSGEHPPAVQIPVYKPDRESKEEFFKRAVSVLEKYASKTEALYDDMCIHRKKEYPNTNEIVYYWLAWCLVEDLPWRKMADRTAERGWREYTAHTTIKEQVENLAIRLDVRLKVKART